MLTTMEFVVALVAILLGSAFFTNAIEILGGRLGLRQGAVGSLLAAVGTALPESMIAVVAILEPVLTGEAAEEGALIGIGAILGAPFMLATLAMFVVGVSALVFQGRREQGTGLRVDAATIGRDVGFFLVFFAVAASVGLVELPLYIKVAVALVLAFGTASTSGEHSPPASISRRCRRSSCSCHVASTRRSSPSSSRRSRASGSSLQVRTSSLTRSSTPPRALGCPPVS